MKTKLLKTFVILITAVLIDGCDSNSHAPDDGSYFRLNPDEITIVSNSTNVTLQIEGGSPPFIIRLFDESLGSVATPDTNTYDRSIIYTANSKEGVNTLEVEDKNHWTCTARIFQYQYSFSISPSSLTMDSTQETQLFNVSGTSYDVKWSVSDTTLGSMEVLDSHGYIAQYTRTDKTGINILKAKDANGVEKTVTIMQN